MLDNILAGLVYIQIGPRGCFDRVYQAPRALYSFSFLPPFDGEVRLGDMTRSRSPSLFLFFFFVRTSIEMDCCSA